MPYRERVESDLAPRQHRLAPPLKDNDEGSFVYQDEDMSFSFEFDDDLGRATHVISSAGTLALLQVSDSEAAPSEDQRSFFLSEVFAHLYWHGAPDDEELCEGEAHPQEVEMSEEFKTALISKYQAIAQESSSAP